VAGRLKPLDRLRGAQDLASAPDHHAALAASAGTGKTHVLTARVLRLLLRGVAPEAILCLTFTKAGAAEMDERIRSRLAYWVRLKQAALGLELKALGEEPTPPLMERARSLFARVLEAPGGGLRVQTIHAFAQSLLASFPAEAGLTPGFRPMEEREERLLARSTLADMLVRAEAGGDLPLIRDVQALSLELGEKDAASLLQACARVPEAMEALGPAQGIEARLRDVFELPSGDVEDIVVASCGDDLFDCASVRRIAELNRAWGTKSGVERANICDAWLAATPSERGAMLDALHGVWAKDGGSALRSFGRGQAPPDPDYAGLAEAAFDYCARLRMLRRLSAWVALAAAGLRAGQAYARFYADAKRTQGLVDFDDLIREAQRLLATEGMGDWVRYKLDQQTDHILVDEAQDTNAAQWSIVDALTGEYFAGRGAGERHRTIFTVGDFKQAIFSFQGTDPAEFEKARRRFREAAQAVRGNVVDLFTPAEKVPPDFLDLSMDRSFRSAPPVLAAVDRVIAELGHEAFGLPQRPNPHVSHKGDLPGSVTLWRPFTGEADEDEDVGEEGWLSEAVRRYAGELARQVKAWLNAPFLVGSGKDRRPLQPQDILILVRRRGDLAGLVVARLHAEGVPVAGIDRLVLSAPLAVQDLLAAARFAIQPLDDLNLAGLLVSPLIGWSQDDLYEAAFRRSGALWPHLRARAERGEGRDLAPLYDMLRWADLATPHEYLENLLSGPLQGRRKLIERLGAEARDPIEELLSSALSFEQAGAPSLARFLDWFARGDVEIVRDPSAPLDAVRVMTVHGAKGLEAPVVILADACADPARVGPAARFTALPIGGDKAPVPRPRKDELAEPLKSIVEDQERRDREEHWRLLYVAMTRAKERLFVGGALTAGAKGPPEASWFGAVERALSGLGGEWVEDERWGGALCVGEELGRKVHPQLLHEIVEGSSALPGREGRGRTPLQHLLEGRGVVLPAFLNEVAPVEERPPRPLAPSAIGADEAAYPPPNPEQRREALRGRLLHRLFERLPDVPPAERRARAEAWLARSGDAPDSEFRAALIDDACRVIDDPRFADLFSPAALAEAPIAAVIGGGLVVAGTVDRLLVSPERVLVADFKTGRRVPASAEEAPLSHLRQMAGYRAALRVIFPDRPVAAALLYTAGPLLLPLPEALLDRYPPGGA
jgi:ATP-dependent helicase/nuclease subunit A